MKYPLPTLSAVNDGALFDARMRLAIQILLSPNFVNDSVLRASDNARSGELALTPTGEAMALAEQLFDEAETRGWITPLESLAHGPTDLEVDHVKRNAHAQVLGQLHANKVAQDQQSGVVRPGVFGMPGMKQ